MRRASRKKRLIATIIVLAGFALALWWRSGPAFELYISPPIKAGNRTVRVQVLIPAGWKALPPSFDFLDAERKLPVTEMHIQPHPGWTWLPGWAREFIGAEPEPLVDLEIDYGIESQGASEWTFHDSASGARCSSAVKTLHTSAGNFMLTYCRANRRAFDATYRQIWDSFKIVP